MGKYQLFIVFAMFSSQATAEWELLSNNDESSLYIDKSTINKQGGYTAMWSMINYNSEQILDPGAYWSLKTLHLYNCQERTMGAKAIANYDEQMGLGKVILSDSKKSFEVEFEDVLPDSLGEAMLKAACGKK